jgi:hypothetical protein
MADCFGYSSATWLSGLEYVEPCPSEQLREVANVGTFPATFDSLQGNEQGRSLLLLCPHRMALSSVKKTGGMVFQVVENSKKRLARPLSLSV